MSGNVSLRELSSAVRIRFSPRATIVAFLTFSESWEAESGVARRASSSCGDAKTDEIAWIEDQ